MARPRILDLFCCEGGAAVGYHRAGFDVVGVDRDPQPLYPFTCLQADALWFLEEHMADEPTLRIDAIHASPPCQSYTTMSNRHGSDELELIDAVRDLCQELGVYRPRLFESNVLLMSPPKAPRPVDAAAVYGVREDRRLLWTRADGTELRAATLDQARVAMGMPWASWNGVREAIPPAYTEHIGAQLLAHVKAAA